MNNNDDQYVIGVDVGSSYIKCKTFDKNGSVKASAQRLISVSSPKEGQIEMDPFILWNDFKETFKECLKSGGTSLHNIRSIGISVQRNSFLLWERHTSKPLTPIISWLDTRSENSVRSWNESWRLKILNYSSKLAYFFTGNKRFFAASILTFKCPMVNIRLYDILKNNPKLSERARQGEVCYGCIETWLLWCLTKGKEFATDATCASMTGIYDPFTCKWSDTLLDLLNLPREILPEVRNTDTIFGETCGEFLCDNISSSTDNRGDSLYSSVGGGPVPISCLMGDSQAATVGVGCRDKGQGKITLGTGSFLSINTGSVPHFSVNGLYPVIGYKITGQLNYCVEGYFPCTGTTIEWLKQLELFKTYEELEEMLQKYSNEHSLEDDDLYFVPAFNGLQVPVYDPLASGLLIGLSPRSLGPSIVHAVMEAIPMHIKWILEEAQKETGIQLKSVRVNGNVCRSNWILQRLADVTNDVIEVSDDCDASCRGAAYLAGLKTGFWETKDIFKVGQVYYPNENKRALFDKRFTKWKAACLRSTKWKS